MQKSTIFKRALLLCAFLLPAFAASWAYSFVVDDIYYNKSGTNATVTYKDYSYNSYSGDVVIPETVEYSGTTYTVTAINSMAFYICDSLTSVTIPSTVASIGIDAFMNCTLLESVTIQNAATTIGNMAFKGCSALSSLNLGSGVTSIGDQAFYGCTSLAEVVIPDSCESIGNYAFYGCSSLASLDLGSGVATIGNYAFQGCASLTKVVIPDSVTELGTYVFSDCTALTEAVVGDGVTEITKYLFSGCTALETLVIGDGVTAIDADAFSGFASLSSLTLGSSVETIGSNAFYGCTSLTEVVIPDSCESIGFGAFEGCSSLSSLTLGTGLTEIGEQAFAHCTSLEEAVIPDNVTDLGTYLFYGCSSLSSVAIGAGVTSIPSHAFDSCEALTDVSLGENVVSIETEAFYDCASLTTITLPESLESIGDEAFMGCDVLMEVISLNPTPPTISASSFSIATLEEGTIVVPEGSEEAYAEASTWASFYSISDGVTTMAATDITTSSATLNGQVITDVIEALSQGFEYGTAEDLEGASSQTAEMDGEGNFSISVSSLTEGQTYYYRAWAETSDGTVHGEILYFAAVDSPKVTTLDATEVGPDYATLNALIEIDNQENLLGYGFLLTDTNPIIEWTVELTAELAEDGSMSLELPEGLEPETDYYVWAYAVNLNGTVTGDYVKFTTEELIDPEVTTSEEVTDITVSSATISGTITGNQKLTEYGFQYYIDEVWEDAETVEAELDAEGNITATITGLDPSTEYVFRAYAVIGGETYYGSGESFTTADVAIITSILVEDGSDEATLNGKLADGVEATEYGFLYGESDNVAEASEAPDTYTKEGGMTCTLTGLEEGVQYYVWAYAVIDGTTCYSEMMTFTAADASTTTIDGICSDEIQAVEIARYDLSGRLLSAPQKGVNIVLYSDGTAKKIVVKE